MAGAPASGSPWAAWFRRWIPRPQRLGPKRGADRFGYPEISRASVSETAESAWRTGTATSPRLGVGVVVDGVLLGVIPASTLPASSPSSRGRPSWRRCLGVGRGVRAPVRAGRGCPARRAAQAQDDERHQGGEQHKDAGPDVEPGGDAKRLICSASSIRMASIQTRPQCSRWRRARTAERGGRRTSRSSRSRMPTPTRFQTDRRGRSGEQRIGGHASREVGIVGVDLQPPGRVVGPPKSSG